jgi:hypothetical protein
MKVLKFRTFRWKKDNNSKIGNGIYFKIAGYVDLDMLQIFASVTTVWRVIPLEMHFFVDSPLLVTQIIKGKQLYYKMWSSKS